VEAHSVDSRQTIARTRAGQVLFIRLPSVGRESYPLVTDNTPRRDAGTHFVKPLGPCSLRARTTCGNLALRQWSLREGYGDRLHLVPIQRKGTSSHNLRPGQSCPNRITPVRQQRALCRAST